MNDSMISHLDKNNKKVNCLIQTRKYNGNHIEYDAFEGYECTIASIKQNFNSSQYVGELILPMLFPLAKFRRQSTREWINASTNAIDFDLVEISIEISAAAIEENNE